ncbi:MAG: hypothetical protein WC365_09395 [Candidatus Babeliales bacterium]|jgi:hypothetical protein
MEKLKTGKTEAELVAIETKIMAIIEGSGLTVRETKHMFDYLKGAVGAYSQDVEL